MTEARTVDVVVVGGGMVGASIAHFLSDSASVLLVDMEASAGYHSTGRSAALFAESYGPAGIRALTRASRSVFESAPQSLTTGPVLLERGAMFVGREDQGHELAALSEKIKAEGGNPKSLDHDQARSLVPVLRGEAAANAILDSESFDIDVDLLLQGFLRSARSKGTEIHMSAKVVDIKSEHDSWTIWLSSGEVVHSGCVVNAAGAWADEFAMRAGISGIGLQPRRRSAFLFDPPAEYDVESWPAVIDVDESWYFKPDAGVLLGSPANADADRPHDVVAEEIDIATGIYRIEEATTMSITRPKSTWAGLRSFVADGEPVCGGDPEKPTFFWAAALGGYGIQSAPAFGKLSASLILGEALPGELTSFGVDPGTFSPARLRLKRTSSTVSHSA